MAKSRNGLTAAGLSVLGAFAVLLAFMTKNWLVDDGEMDDPKLDRIGLWVVCFKNYEDPNHWYDTKFKCCKWIFEDEHHILREFIFKGFYTSTQVLFLISVIFTVIGLFYTASYMTPRLNTSVDKNIQYLFTIWRLNLTAALCGTIALIIFGVHGNSRVWMPQWEHKRIGWSYIVGVAGIVVLYISGILFLIEERARKIKRQKKTATLKKKRLTFVSI